jgi:hypothetical protein
MRLLQPLATFAGLSGYSAFSKGLAEHKENM